MHFVIYLPSNFYSTIASTAAEVLQAINDLTQKNLFTYEFVSKESPAVAKTGVSFASKPQPARKMDVLLVLASWTSGNPNAYSLLEEEINILKPLVSLAKEQKSLIAATCAASYLLAGTGILNNKQATIAWWMKKEAAKRFPKVRWEPSRILVRDDKIYTTGGTFSGLELISALLIDLGFLDEEQLARKVMVMPPVRQFQSPYEIAQLAEPKPFEKQLNKLAEDRLSDLTPAYIAQEMALSARTLSRRFIEELNMTPGKWIQDKKLTLARCLLENNQLSISQICTKVGYKDPASFSRLFTKETGLSPGQYRRHFLS